MLGRKASESQRLLCYQMHVQGLGPSQIKKTLDREFGDQQPVSHTTVWRWVGAFKKEHADSERFDRPFQWHLLEAYGIPWEASAYLLEMWSFVMERTHAEFESRHPSGRQIRWCWRVHLAASDLPILDTWSLAQRFAQREIDHEILGIPLDMADLEAHLGYRSWEGCSRDKDKFLCYRKAVEDERIPTAAPGQ